MSDIIQRIESLRAETDRPLQWSDVHHANTLYIGSEDCAELRHESKLGDWDLRGKSYNVFRFLRVFLVNERRHLHVCFRPESSKESTS